MQTKERVPVLEGSGPDWLWPKVKSGQVACAWARGGGNGQALGREQGQGPGWLG